MDREEERGKRGDRTGRELAWGSLASYHSFSQNQGSQIMGLRPETGCGLGREV